MTTAGLLAADAPSALTTWSPVLIAVITGLVGVFGTLGTIWVRRQSRSVDDATAAKTHAEAEKVRVDRQGQEVEIARSLLAEIRTELERVRADQIADRKALKDQLAEQAATSERRHQEMIQEAEKRHQQLADELATVHARQETLRRQLDEHIPWDIAAREMLRAEHPDFPEPPPIGADQHRHRF